MWRSEQPLHQSLVTCMPRPCSENGRSVLGTSGFRTPATTCSCWDPRGSCATRRKPQVRESQIREDTEEEVVPRQAGVNHVAPSRPPVGSRGLGGAVHTSGHRVGVCARSSVLNVPSGHTTQSVAVWPGRIPTQRPHCADPGYQQLSWARRLWVQTALFLAAALTS